MFLVIEANRVWFVRLKNYLIERYKRVRLSEKDIGTSYLLILILDLPEKPEISVRPLSPYSVAITILNESINEEAPYVVRYKSLPQVVFIPMLPFRWRFFRTQFCVCWQISERTMKGDWKASWRRFSPTRDINSKSTHWTAWTTTSPRITRIRFELRRSKARESSVFRRRWAKERRQASRTRWSSQNARFRWTSSSASTPLL